MKSQRGIRGTAPLNSGTVPLILKLGSRHGVVGQRHVFSALPPEGSKVHIIQEAGWAPGSFWTCVESPSPLGFDPRTFQLVKTGCFCYALPVSCIHREMMIMMTMMVIIIIIIINEKYVFNKYSLTAWSGFNK